MALSTRISLSLNPGYARDRSVKPGDDSMVGVGQAKNVPHLTPRA
jgi:hypothetical protein